MENKAYATAAGLFTLFLLAISIGVYLWLDRDTTIRKRYTLVAEGNVTGLNPYAAVRYKGLEVGRVESIELSDDLEGEVLVKIGVGAGTPISTATRAELGMQGVTGLTFIQLTEAKGAPKKPLPEGEATRISLKPSLVDRLAASGEGFIAKAEGVATRLDGLLADTNQKQIIATISSIEQTAKKTSALADSLNHDLPPLVQALKAQIPPLAADARKAVNRADTAMAELQTLTQNLNSKLSKLDQIDKVAGDFSKSLLSFDRAALAVESAGDRLDSEVLLKFGRLAEAATKSSRQIGNAAESLERSPQSLLWGNSPRRPGPGEVGFTLPPPPARPQFTK